MFQSHRNAFYLVILSGVILLNMTLTESTLLGVLGFTCYLIVLTSIISRNVSGIRQNSQFAFPFLLSVSYLILANSLAYYLYATNTFSIAAVLLLPLLIFAAPRENGNQEKSSDDQRQPPSPLLFGAVVIDIVLIVLLFSRQTTDLMPSPWGAIGPLFFFFYAVAFGLLIYGTRKSTSTLSIWIAHALHLFLTLGVTAILYPLGFGFDAFIHRATEEWIVMNGSITPKTPYYIGQYGIVAFLRHVTQLKLFTIDVFLVPLLASISLSGFIPLVIKKAWNSTYQKVFPLIWIIPFVPFLTGYLNLTTPFNLAFLFAILAVFGIVGYMINTLPYRYALVFALVSAFAHPLVGAPVALFVIGAYVYKRTKKSAVRKLTLAGIAVWMSALPAMMFIANNIIVGIGAPLLVNPLARISYFFALFERPYWYAKTSPAHFEALYIWAWLIVPLVIALAIHTLLKKRNDDGTLLFLSGAIGMFVGSWILRSWLIFPNVVSYEQGDFPLRIAKLSLIFLLPLAMAGILKLSERKTSRLLTVGVVTTLCILMTLSFYLSYPQRNAKVRFPGFNVTQADFDAVRWIDSQNSDYQFVVLSNQLVSSAALTEYGFAQYFKGKTIHDPSTGEILHNQELFYYSIPTGGPLYKQYGKMLYEGQLAAYMETAMDLSGVKKSYFVVNAYWANAEEIVDGAKKTATSWHSIDDVVWVFVYER